MAEIKFSQLNEAQLDVLGEIGNIGTGNAATALSNLIGCKIDLHLPVVRLLDFDSTPEFLGGNDNQVVGMMVRVVGDVRGMMLHVMKTDFVNSLLRNFFGKEIPSLNELDDMDRSMINEIGNITTATYVNALSEMLGMFIDIQPPEQHIDTVGNIVAIPRKELGDSAQQLLFIDQNLVVENGTIESNMIFIPETEAMNAILEKCEIIKHA